VSAISVPDHFELSVERHGEDVIVKLTGEFDIACEEYFEAALRPLEEPGSSVVVDLSALTFMDSTGLNQLIAAHERSGRRGFRLAIVPGDAHIRRTFELTGLDRILPMVDGQFRPDSSAPAMSAA
jgi:anti-sigma B factor antagonist